MACPAAKTPLGSTRAAHGAQAPEGGGGEGVARVGGALGEVQAARPARPTGAIAERMRPSCSVTAARWASFSTVPAAYRTAAPSTASSAPAPGRGAAERAAELAQLDRAQARVGRRRRRRARRWRPASSVSSTRWSEIDRRGAVEVADPAQQRGGGALPEGVDLGPERAQLAQQLLRVRVVAEDRAVDRHEPAAAQRLREAGEPRQAHEPGGGRGLVGRVRRPTRSSGRGPSPRASASHASTPA